MKHILFGNGLVIQFSGSRYTNSSIIMRSLEKVESGDFPSHLYPKECASLLQALHGEYELVLRGDYDRYAVAGFERSALADFKRRYSKKPRMAIDEVGFEDYFLIFELLHNKLGVGNPDRFHSRGVLRRMLLDSIFDGGAIQIVYQRFPRGLIDLVAEHDSVFTTNYDQNLESVCDNEVFHLHGAFHVLSETYDPNSFRNQLSDDLLDGEKVDPDYPHLYSDCLLSYVSELKSYSMRQSDLANSAMEKFAEAYRTDSSIRRQIDDWDEGPSLVRRLREAIRLKVDRPELSHQQQYPSGKLLEISGMLTIIGLSPNNDNHVFAEIIENGAISSVDYYCFSGAESKEALALLEGKDVSTRDVRELWRTLEED